MSLLAVRIGAGVLVLLALLTLLGKRWAYFAFVVLGLLYFPAQTHFRVHVPKCEQLLPTIQVLVLSLHNYAFIALFAGFYWMSWVQFRRADARVVWALLATLLVGVLVEIAEGMTMTGRGHCRLRDLVPDAAGALGAALLLAVWSRLRRKPAYVRLVKPRSATAPPAAAPTSRTVVPPRGVVPPPPPPASAQPGTRARPAAPPPPPPRPLQSEAEGYYEPSYKFTVSDRRFTRLTLRPEPFVTFSRPGIRDEVGCADARITPAAVHLRCEFERVGIVVTIEGQFPSRTVTSRLDAPVLDGMVTVTNTRGETLFRARQPFYWHAPE